MLCVIAKLDDAATEKLETLRRAALDGADGRPLHGHITLATYTGAEEARFLRSCRELLEGVSAFSVAYERLDVLEETSILVAFPGRSAPLEALHRRIAQRCPGELDLWTGTERWTPHTTLLYDPARDLRALCRRLEPRFAPFRAGIGRIEFSRARENAFEVIDALTLPSPC